MSRLPLLPFRTIRGRLNLVLISLGIVILLTTAASLPIDYFIEGAGNWRVASVRGEAIAQELKYLFARSLHSESPHDRETVMNALKAKISEMDNHFILLAGGNDKQRLPALTQEDILRTITVTDKYWQEQLKPLLLQPIDSASHFEVTRKIESSFDTFSSAVSVGVSLSHDVLQQRIQHLKMLQYVLLSFGAIVAAIAFFRVLELARRLSRVSETANRISGGDLGVQASEEGTDEVAALGKAFNQMTDRLIREKSYSDNIIRSMGEMLLIVSTTGHIVRVNTAVQSATGYSESELELRNLDAIIANEDYFTTLLFNITKHGSQTDSAVCIRRKDSSALPASLTATALHGKDGKVEAAILLLKDMTGYNLLLEETERRAAAEATATAEKMKSTELEVLNRKLKETQTQVIETSKFAALGEMAGGIAHEINNPLAIIHGKAGQLRDMAETGNLDPASAITIAEKIEATAMRVARIVKGLRTFARDAKNEPMQQMSMRDIIQDTLDLCREKFKTHGVELRVPEIPPELNLRCRGVQISQVLLNLLNNAHDAIEELPERWVSVEVQRRGDTLDLIVTDSGPGIPPEVRAKLMQPFFTTKPVGKGTGLGLSISRSIVESHDGKLQIDPGCPNTRFVVSFPLAN